MEVLPETVTEAKEAPPLPETVTEVVKKGRGRPRKEKIETEPTETPRKRGRPKTEINISEIREKMELQKQINISKIMEKMEGEPKTNTTADKNYYTQWYSAHYKGVCMTCPSCKNPNVNVAKIHRHMRTIKCLRDTTFNKYSETGI